MKPINIIKRLNESDGWIAFYKGNKVEISKDEASSLYGAKQVAIQKLNVPKSKVSELAIEPAYNDDNLDNAPASNAQFEAADPEAKFSGVEFEKNIPHEMRFKEYDVLDNDELYWVTQEPFEERDLLDFAKALQETRFNKAYVTVRDLSTYDYNKDKENNVLAVVSKENGIEDFDGYWNEAKVFFDEDVEESNLKESRYSEIEESDPVLDKTIRVYDINALLDKELKPSEDGTKYESYDFGTGAAIILKPDGTGCIVDYEAVGTKFNSKSEIVDVYLRPNETEVDGHRAIYVMPTAKVQLSIDELLKAPSKDVKVRDFFTKWDYNDRCASNFRGILPYLRDDKITEAIEQKYEKSNPDYNSFLRDVKRYTGSYDYEFGGKVNTECYGYPVTVQYFCYNRPYVGGGYKVEFNVLTPVNTFVGDNIQEALESSFGGYSQTKPTQKEIKDKVLQVVSDIDKED